MQEGQPKMPKRRSEDHSEKGTEAERKQLTEDIVKMQDHINSIDRRVQEQRYKQQKMNESNLRNQKRLLRYRARIEEMIRYKDSPEHLLSISGYMNESVQQYILSHNYTFTTDPHSVPDPDNMTYEQLLDLGQKIGKVSKGLSKEQIQKLSRKMNKREDEKCPICQCEFELREEVIELRCCHLYHEECILCWLKDENTCPMCKESLVSAAQAKKEEDKYEY